MAIFRLQENVPDVYPRKSRDFQLICNAFDCVNNGVKYDIDTILSVVDTKMCNENLLPLLQTKLGFFSKKEFTATQLRSVLQSFKHVVKNKGSLLGIRDAIELYLKIANASNRADIKVINIDDSLEEDKPYARLSSSYVVNIGIESRVLDTTILTELLRYVLPAGYRLEYMFFSAVGFNTVTVEDSTIKIVFLNDSDDVSKSDVNNAIALSAASELISRLTSADYAKEGRVSTTHAIDRGPIAEEEKDDE